MADELRLGGLGGEAGVQSGAYLTNDLPVPPVPGVSAENWPSIPPGGAVQGWPTTQISFEAADRMATGHWPSIPPFGSAAEGFSTTPMPDFFF